MSDTPDLNKAREASNRAWHASLTTMDLIYLILEQRAEEAERCAEFLYDSEFPGSLPLKSHAADLRRQAAGGEK